MKITNDTIYALAVKIVQNFDAVRPDYNTEPGWVELGDGVVITRRHVGTCSAIDLYIQGNYIGPIDVTALLDKDPNQFEAGLRDTLLAYVDGAVNNYVSGTVSQIVEQSHKTGFFNTQPPLKEKRTFQVNGIAITQTPIGETGMIMWSIGVYGISGSCRFSTCAKESMTDKLIQIVKTMVFTGINHTGHFSCKITDEGTRVGQ